MENILKLTQINKSFPGVKALSDVNLTVRKGEVHALVGENGAGKSTLMKIISGAYKKDSGTVWFDGQEVENTTPKQSEMMGISIIYQELNLIERITVAENVFIGRYPMKHGMVQWKEMFQQAQALFDEYELKINAKSLVRSLTMAQKQMVEIIKVLGTPTAEEIHEMNPNYHSFKFPNIPKKELGTVGVGETCDEGVRSLSRRAGDRPDEQVAGLRAEEATDG